MYNLIRNTTFTGLSVYGSSLIFSDLTNAAICGVVFSLGVILTNTLFSLSNHQSDYINMRKNIGSSVLDSFDDDGAHLPSMYTYLKDNVCAELIDKKTYLGDNKVLFERPYRFINDTKNIVRRVMNDIEYINKVPKSSFEKYSGVLFTNDYCDDLKKTRYEFYITNMESGKLRDSLVEKYRKSYGNEFNIQTSEELKLIEDRKNRIKNLPDHLNSEVKF